jgi:hypothetical protein
VERAGSRKAWEYRWYEAQPDGKRRRRNLVLGTLEQYPNETAAQKAVVALRVDINVESPRTSLGPMSVQMLVDHYRQKELGEDSNKTYATCRTYEGYFRKWILPRWGEYRVKDVRAVVVEEWLRSLKLSNGSKAKMRNIMHAVFNHAIRWEWHDKNPITHVRQSAKRARIPLVLTIEETAALLDLLREPARTAVFLDVLTGLRVGELLALKWSDIDFEKLQISVTRSIVMQHLGECKTEAIPQAGASRSPARGIALQLAVSKPLSVFRGLGVCKSALEWEIAVLAWRTLPGPHSASSQENGNRGNRLAYLPPHLRDVPQSQR